MFHPVMGGERERNIDAVLRQRAAGAVRPFHHHDRVRGLIKAEFGEFIRAGDAVEISVDDAKARQIVVLHQRKGRARHLDGGVVREMRDHGAHERRLAGAEIARKRNEVAGLQHVGDIGR